MNELTSDVIDKAYNHLKGTVKETPLELDLYLSQKYECNVYLKREDLQWVRSFKLRGAYNAVASLTNEARANGISCASAGNHAQGIAYTAAKFNINAEIFMPITTPQQKINQVAFFGGDQVNIHLVGDTFDECLAHALQYSNEHCLSFIDPFNNMYTIAGQGTVATEILNQTNEPLHYCFGAIGGGGLISGVGTYMKHHSKDTIVVGVEPTGAASMMQAILEGKVVELTKLDKFVDGAAVAKVGEITYNITKNVVDEFVEVDTGLVCTTILDMYTKQAIVAEPAGALSVAALEHYKDEIKGKNIVCIISGGNNDINRMAEIEERALLYEQMKHYFIINFPQRPGALREFVNNVLGPEDDITKFEYLKKASKSKGAVIIGIQLKQPTHLQKLIERMTTFDSKYIYINDDERLYSLLI